MQLTMHGMQQHHSEERGEVLGLRRAGARGGRILPGVAYEPRQAKVGHG